METTINHVISTNTLEAADFLSKRPLLSICTFLAHQIFRKIQKTRGRLYEFCYVKFPQQQKNKTRGHNEKSELKTKGKGETVSTFTIPFLSLPLYQFSMLTDIYMHISAAGQSHIVRVNRAETSPRSLAEIRSL